jgi:hypothetical protein
MGGGVVFAPPATDSAPRAPAASIDVNKSTSDGKMAGRPPRFRMSAESSGNARSREEPAQTVAVHP